MYIVEDKAGAIALMVGALILLGTWPAIMNSLERRGRLLQHTYLDYSITNFLGAVFIAFTLGQIGLPKDGQPNFLDQLGQDNLPSVGFALASGLVISMCNLGAQYGWPFVGLALTQVMTSSISVVFGTTMNYFLDGRINSAKILFPGVMCFLMAVGLGSLLHASDSGDTRTKIRLAEKDNTVEDLNSPFTKDIEKWSFSLAHEEENAGKGEEIGLVKKVESGSAEFFKDLDEKRAVKTLKIGRASHVFGIGIVLIASLCCTLFSPFFNLATNDQLHFLKPGVPKLVVYTAFFYFSVSAVIFGVCANVVLLYHPIVGLPKSSLSAYLKDWDGRLWALLAGILCSFGNGFQFMGGQAAGYAAADAVQAMPLVTLFWGIVIFKEYHQSSRKTYIYLVSTAVMFLAAVVLLSSSAGHRS